MQFQKHRFIMLSVWLLLCGNAAGEGPSSVLAPGQWTAEQARRWCATQPWLVGCSFLPSTAVNDVEMWQGDTFDATTIERAVAEICQGMIGTFGQDRRVVV